MNDHTGDRPARATLRMVAERAGVSTATVSYVLSGRSGGRTGVSEATVLRVREAAQHLDYLPNQAARAIRTGRNRLVLLSLTMLADPWSQAVADAVSAAVAPSGLTALILADGDWPETLARQPADVAFIDAVIDADQRTAVRRLASRGQRLVVFDDQLQPDGFDVIRSPADAGCRMAVRRLLADHDRIGCLASSPTSERTRAYTEELEAAGVRQAEPEYFDRNASSAFAAATRMLNRPEPPTAIYATTDFAAISAIQAAHRMQLHVPDDVAIIGVGNTLEAERTRPSLSSVGPTDLFGRLGEILLARATGDDVGPGTLHEFTWSLVERESTHTPAPEMPAAPAES